MGGGRFPLNGHDHVSHGASRRLVAGASLIQSPGSVGLPQVGDTSSIGRSPPSVATAALGSGVANMAARQQARQARRTAIESLRKREAREAQMATGIMQFR